MLPFIVISAAILFFLLNRSGVFNDARRGNGEKGRARKRWGQRFLDELESDPELNQRLDVFKDFLEGQSDEEEKPQ